MAEQPSIDNMDTSTQTSLGQSSTISTFRKAFSFRGHDYDQDPFANMTFSPPKAGGYYRYAVRRSKFNALAALSGSRERLCSVDLEPAKMMSMQEDAKARKISAEVMKSRLYESVIASPRRRRFSTRVDYHGPLGPDSVELSEFQGMARMARSLPVTPLCTPSTSQNVTPSTSPKSARKFFGFLSRGATPEDEAKSIGSAGLASLFIPEPRLIPATSNKENTLLPDDLSGQYPGESQADLLPTFLSVPASSPGGSPRPLSPSFAPINMSHRELNAVAPTSL